MDYHPRGMRTTGGEKLLESTAGVAESSGRIQVSVRHKMLSAVWEAIAEIKSALLTAD